MKRYRVMMGTLLVLEALLGLVLMIGTVYLDEVVYLSMTGALYNLLFVPGLMLVLLLFHFLIFKTYENKASFGFTSAVMAWTIGATAEVLVLLANGIPSGWFDYIPAMFGVVLVTGLLIYLIHFLFSLLYRTDEANRAVVEKKAEE